MGEKTTGNGLDSVANTSRLTVLVTHVNEYAFQNESNENVHGITVEGAVARPEEPGSTKRGWPSFRNSVSLEESGRFTQIPGVYSASFEITKKGIRCEDFKFERGLAVV